MDHQNQALIATLAHNDCKLDQDNFYRCEQRRSGLSAAHTQRRFSQKQTLTPTLFPEGPTTATAAGSIDRSAVDLRAVPPSRAYCYIFPETFRYASQTAADPSPHPQDGDHAFSTLFYSNRLRLRDDCIVKTTQTALNSGIWSFPSASSQPRQLLEFARLNIPLSTNCTRTRISHGRRRERRKEQQ